MTRVVFLSVFGFAAAFALLQVQECTPGDAELSMLELRVGDEQGENKIEDFSPTGIFYSASLPPKPETAVLIVEAKDPSATIEVKHDGQVVPLQNGAAELQAPFQGSELHIRVSPPAGVAWTYHVHIERGRSLLELLQFVEARVSLHMTPSDVAGLAIAVMGPEGVAIERKYGMANVEESIPFETDTPSGLGSLSKSFASAATMILYEEGRLQPDDSIADTFPEAPAEWSAITIHHLLTHQSGIPDHINDRPNGGLSDWTNEDVLSWAVLAPLEFQPEERMEYSNTGYVLLALLVERISGQSFESFVEERIFAPLGMVNSIVPDDSRPLDIPGRAVSYLRGEVTDPAPRSTGDRGQYSSLEDLKKFELALRSNTLLSADTMDLMTTTGVPFNEAGTNIPVPDCDTGYGWFVCDRASEPLNVWNQGRFGGYRTQISRAPDEGVATIVVSNGTFDWALIELAYNLHRFYLGLDLI